MDPVNIVWRALQGVRPDVRVDTQLRQTHQAVLRRRGTLLLRTNGWGLPLGRGCGLWRGGGCLRRQLAEHVNTVDDGARMKRVESEGAFVGVGCALEECEPITNLAPEITNLSPETTLPKLILMMANLVPEIIPESTRQLHVHHTELVMHLRHLGLELCGEHGFLERAHVIARAASREQRADQVVARRVQRAAAAQRCFV